MALIAVTKRFTAMNRVILIFNVGGFTMGNDTAKGLGVGHVGGRYHRGMMRTR